jgi:hypothetical protein
MNPAPVFHPLQDGTLASGASAEGPFRAVVHAGRTGLLAGSIHSRLHLPGHNLNEPRGTLCMWAMAMEDLCTWSKPGSIDKFEPDWTGHTLLADRAPQRQWKQASFAWVWDAAWYPQYFAKFYKGGIYDNAPAEPMGLVMAAHWIVHRRHWYHLALTWDKPASDYRLYVNGVLIATSNRFQQLGAETIAPTLFGGHPCWAMSDLRGWNEALPAGQILSLQQAQATAPSAEIDDALRRTYCNEPAIAFDWRPDENWQTSLQTPLNRPEDLKLFYVQGCPSAPSITERGLEIKTPLVKVRSAEGLDMAQVYLWTWQAFEGDVAVEFEFMPLRENGLSLLCIQASGMQREDFMADHPLRATGSMEVAYNENVRNYHFEFFREMDDCRNDVASFALVKEPWQHPLAYTCFPHRLAQGQWHRFQFVQHDGRIRAAVDGRLLFDITEDPFGGQGPILQSGHLGIRCMYKSHMAYRNLRILNRRDSTPAAR